MLDFTIIQHIFHLIQFIFVAIGAREAGEFKRNVAKAGEPVHFHNSIRLYAFRYPISTSRSTEIFCAYVIAMAGRISIRASDWRQWFLRYFFSIRPTSESFFVIILFNYLRIFAAPKVYLFKLVFHLQENKCKFSWWVESVFMNWPAFDVCLFYSYQEQNGILFMRTAFRWIGLLAIKSAACSQ